MKTEKLDVVQVCKQFEDVLAPRLRLSPIEGAVYWHLLRHSLLEGRARLRFSLVWAGRPAPRFRCNGALDGAPADRKESLASG